MKTPDYVATVTRIYRKYIDIALNKQEYKVSDNDKKDLLQVFNRGGFSSGHLDIEPNKNLIFPVSSANIGMYIGNISNYNSNKGHITLNLNESVSIGDNISIEGETGRYTISELMVKDKNLKTADAKTIVKLGRMKGNIKVGSKVYKLSDKALSKSCEDTYSVNSNIKKIPLNCTIEIKKNLPISIKLESLNNFPFYNGISIKYISEIVPEIATNMPITKDRIISQFSKLGNTPYVLNNINVNMDDNLHIPSISALNEIRRNAISMLSEKVLSNSITNRVINNINIKENKTKNKNISIDSRKISVLLQNININEDYSKLNNINNIYIPLKYLANPNYSNLLVNLSNKFNMYVYMPTIVKANYKNLFLNKIDNIINTFDIKGFVVSNISELLLLDKYVKLDKYEVIANYTMNIFNTYTISELKNLNINIITPSVELSNDIIDYICQYSTMPIELVVYGRMVLMNMSYCMLGKTNKCYPECQMKCNNNKNYYLKDRIGFKFRISPDNIQTVTSIYNSKITSIDTKNFNVSSVRIDILDESVNEINSIIEKVKFGEKLEGEDYTNGNLNRIV